MQQYLIDQYNEHNAEPQQEMWERMEAERDAEEKGEIKRTLEPLNFVWNELMKLK